MYSTKKNIFFCSLRFSLMMLWVYKSIHVAHVNKTNLYTNKFVRTELKDFFFHTRETGMPQANKYMKRGKYEQQEVVKL